MWLVSLFFCSDFWIFRFGKSVLVVLCILYFVVVFVFFVDIIVGFLLRVVLIVVFRVFGKFGNVGVWFKLVVGVFIVCLYEVRFCVNCVLVFESVVWVLLSCVLVWDMFVWVILLIWNWLCEVWSCWERMLILFFCRLMVVWFWMMFMYEVIMFKKICCFVFVSEVLFVWICVLVDFVEKKFCLLWNIGWVVIIFVVYFFV